MTTNTKVRLIELLTAQAGASATVDMAKLVDALGISSLQQAAFLDSVNSEFGVNLAPENAGSVKSLDDLVALIDKS